jgi:hypothetical protein
MKIDRSSMSSFFKVRNNQLRLRRLDFHAVASKSAKAVPKCWIGRGPTTGSPRVGSVTTRSHGQHVRMIRPLHEEVQLRSVDFAAAAVYRLIFADFIDDSFRCQRDARSFLKQPNL